MPIYSYRCQDCEHVQDVLRKISDPLLAVCPSCGASAFRKQVTAAGFQLKGSGWYVTDFRNPPAAKAGAKGKGEKEAGAPEGAASGAGSSDAVSASDKGAPGGDSSANGKAVAPAAGDASSSSGDKGSRSPSPSSTVSTAASD